MKFLVFILSLMMAMPALARTQLIYQLGSDVRRGDDEISRQIQIDVKGDGQLNIKEWVQREADNVNGFNWFIEFEEQVQLSPEWTDYIGIIANGNKLAEVDREPFRHMRVSCANADMNNPKYVINHLYQNTASQGSNKWRLIEGNGACHAGQKARFVNKDLAKVAEKTKHHLAAIALNMVYGEGPVDGDIDGEGPAQPSMLLRYEVELQQPISASGVKAFARIEVLNSGLVEIYIYHDVGLPVAGHDSGYMDQTVAEPDHSFSLNGDGLADFKAFVRKMNRSQIHDEIFKGVCIARHLRISKVDHLYVKWNDGSEKLVFGPNDCGSGRIIRPHDPLLVSQANDIKEYLRAHAQGILQQTYHGL